MDLVRQAMDKYRTAAGDYGDPDQAEPQAAQGRGLLGNRGSQGPDGLLPGQRRDGDSLASPGAQQLLLQPVGDSRAVPGCLIADVPAVVGSLDIVMGEIDR